jgi:hypothetical protein
MEINDIISSHRRMVAECLKKSFGADIEKARVAGDISSDGKKVWTEYAPGKFDWRVIKKKEGKEKTASVKVPRGMQLQDEDAWVEIYDKNGKKIKEDFFEELGFDPDEKWNEKDGNYDIKGGGKMVVPKEGNERKDNGDDDNKVVNDLKAAFSQLEKDYDKAYDKDDNFDQDAALAADVKFYKKIGKLIKDGKLDKDTFFKIKKSTPNWNYGFDVDFDMIKEDYAK